MVDSSNISKILYKNEDITILIADNKTYIESTAKLNAFIFSNFCPLTAGVQFSFENVFKDTFTSATISFNENLLFCMIDNKSNKFIGSYIYLSDNGLKLYLDTVEKMEEEDFTFDFSKIRAGLKMVAIDESEIPLNSIYGCMYGIDHEYKRKGYGTKLSIETFKYLNTLGYKWTYGEATSKASELLTIKIGGIVIKSVTLDKYEFNGKKILDKFKHETLSHVHIQLDEFK